MTRRLPGIQYRINAEGQIVHVSSTWDAFALENNGHNCLSERVLGERLLHFISGSITKQYVDVLLFNTRRKQEEVSRQFRCDSPDLIRRLEMTLRPAPNQEVEISTQTLEILERERVQTIGVNPPHPHSDASTSNFRLMCSTCNLINVNGSWVEPHLHRPTDSTVPIQVIYSICPPCQSTVNVR